MQIAKISSQMSRTKNYQQKNSSKQPSFGVTITPSNDFIRQVVKEGVQDKIAIVLEKVSQRFKNVDYEFKPERFVGAYISPERIEKGAYQKLEPIETLQTIFKNVDNHNKACGNVLNIPEKVKKDLMVDSYFMNLRQNGIFNNFEEPLKKVINLLHNNQDQKFNAELGYANDTIGWNPCSVRLSQEGKPECYKINIFSKIAEKSFKEEVINGQDAYIPFIHPSYDYQYEFPDIDLQFQNVMQTINIKQAEALKKAEEVKRLSNMPSDIKAFESKLNSLNKINV